MKVSCRTSVWIQCDDGTLTQAVEKVCSSQNPIRRWLNVKSSWAWLRLRRCAIARIESQINIAGIGQT